jgi:hypothetical protein
MYEKALTKTVALFLRLSEPTMVKGWYGKKMSNITSELRAEFSVSFSGCSPLLEQRMTVRVNYGWLQSVSLSCIYRAEAFIFLIIFWR